MLEMPSLSVVDFRRTPVPDPLLYVGRDPVQFSFEGERRLIARSNLSKAPINGALACEHSLRGVFHRLTSKSHRWYRAGRLELTLYGPRRVISSNSASSSSISVTSVASCIANANILAGSAVAGSNQTPTYR